MSPNHPPPGSHPGAPRAGHLPGGHVRVLSALEKAFQLLQLHRRKLFALDATLPSVSGLWGLCGRCHLAWLLRRLLPGPLAAIATLVVAVAFLVDVALMVHGIPKAWISFLKVASSGSWRRTLHRLRSYFHFKHSQAVVARVMVLAPGSRRHGWHSAAAQCLLKL